MSPMMRSWMTCLVVAIAIAGCGSDDVFKPTFGTLNIQVLTDGENLDDGYRLLVNGPDLEVDTPSAPEQQFILTIEIGGEYSAELIDIADNCSLDDNPRTYTLEIGSTVRDTMIVTCV